MNSKLFHTSAYSLREFNMFLEIGKSECGGIGEESIVCQALPFELL